MQRRGMGLDGKNDCDFLVAHLNKAVAPPQSRKVARCLSCNMNPIFKKLQFKGHSPLCVLHSPDSFQIHLQEMREVTEIHDNPAPGQQYPFYLAFYVHAAEFEQGVEGLDDCLGEDALLWIAYPKKSSKRYKSDIHRDSTVWQALGALGFEGVRQVAIDEDWSALRFRKAEFIKQMKRDSKRAMSKKGKERTE